MRMKASNLDISHQKGGGSQFTLQLKPNLYFRECFCSRQVVFCERYFATSPTICLLSAYIFPDGFHLACHRIVITDFALASPSHRRLVETRSSFALQQKGVCSRTRIKSFRLSTFAVVGCSIIRVARAS